MIYVSCKVGGRVMVVWVGGVGAARCDGRVRPGKTCEYEHLVGGGERVCYVGWLVFVPSDVWFDGDLSSGIWWTFGK